MLTNKVVAVDFCCYLSESQKKKSRETQKKQLDKLQNEHRKNCDSGCQRAVTVLCGECVSVYFVIGFEMVCGFSSSCHIFSAESTNHVNENS